MAWGVIAAGIGSALASGAMSMYSARQQQDATVDAYKHRHQWQVNDMRAAGLNPVLSATQGAGSVGSMAQAQAPDVGAQINSASSAALNREQATTAKTTQIQQLTQADVNESTAAHQAASAREANARADVAEQTSRIFQKDPELAARKALTEAGYNPNTPLGATSAAVHRLGQFAGGNVHDGGSINATRPRYRWANQNIRNQHSARY